MFYFTRSLHEEAPTVIAVYLGITDVVVAFVTATFCIDGQTVLHEKGMFHLVCIATGIPVVNVMVVVGTYAQVTVVGTVHQDLGISVRVLGSEHVIVVVGGIGSRLLYTTVVGGQCHGICYGLGGVDSLVEEEVHFRFGASTGELISFIIIFFSSWPSLTVWN